MLCDECGKNNATVHLTKIVNDKRSEAHLCEQCAKKYMNLDTNFSIQNIMSGFLTDVPGVEKSMLLVCENCGMTYDEFKRNGKFGCSQCYSSFEKKVAPIVRNIHSHDSHVGKIPLKAGKELKDKKELEDLKFNLREAVENEEYEKAAEYRDKIKEMEEEN